ncbi:hypothetical protein DSB72_30035, partial [Salmonella enterica subsp. enterica serovar Typhimurium]
IMRRPDTADSANANGARLALDVPAGTNSGVMMSFSSDRTIKEYAENIWHIDPVRL